MGEVEVERGQEGGGEVLEELELKRVFELELVAQGHGVAHGARDPELRQQVVEDGVGDHLAGEPRRGRRRRGGGRRGDRALPVPTRGAAPRGGVRRV